MYVLKRTDKEYGEFTKTHETEEEAIEEATRLASKHVTEDPEFTIYELNRVNIISSKIAITIT